MTISPSKKLFVLYVCGLDLRRINPDITPFIAKSLESYPCVRITNYPSNDLVPTILTGTYPPEHGMWGVKLKSNPDKTLGTRLIDSLPDIVTTTFQCFAHALTNSYDLAAIPPRRRRLFDSMRTKYVRRTNSTRGLLRIGDVESCLGVLSTYQSRYLFSDTSDPSKKLLDHLASGTLKLEFLELYSLDRYQAWNLDRPDYIRRCYGRFDAFVKVLYEKCQHNDITLVLVSDHGHEAVKSSIDLKEELKKLAVPEDEYTFFTELYLTRFWFHTDRAREKIGAMLGALDGTTLLSHQDMHRYHLSFRDSQYGELFSVANPGYIFFPHDFHHPLANLYLGLTDSKQRRRLLDPRQRANHGYLPHHEVEKAFMIAFDEGYKSTKEEIELIDIAPSLLEMTGYEKPEYMKGSSCFVPLNADAP